MKKQICDKPAGYGGADVVEALPALLNVIDKGCNRREIAGFDINKFYKDVVP